MSADEDTELRDLVAQTLEANGVLGKIRAQLRASVFLALEEQESVQNKAPFLNQDLVKFLGTKEGGTVAGLVREFLEFFKLEFTLAVFEPESGFGPSSISRESIAHELNVEEFDGPPNAPLLLELIRKSQGQKQVKTKDPDDQNGFPKDVSSQQLAEAKQRFEQYDLDKNGEIDKDELRELLIEMFPQFNRSMLERYVNDEFHATNKTVVNSINFEEFVGIYRRLFHICRSVVSGDVEEFVTSTSVSNGMRDPVANISFRDSRNTNSFVESKNQRNLDHKKFETWNGPSHVERSDTGSDVEDDPFFDDIPSGGRGLGLVSSTNDSGTKSRQLPSTGTNRSTSQPKQVPTATGLSSLQGLPSLTQNKGAGHQNSDEPVEKNSLWDMDRKIAGLVLGAGQEDDYDDDDFHSSGHSLSIKSPRTATYSEHRSQRSQENGSIVEEIEEIDDASIGADDIFKSEQSGYDDLTTDRTISQHDGGFDYMEDPQSPILGSQEGMSGVAYHS